VVESDSGFVLFDERRISLKIMPFAASPQGLNVFLENQFNIWLPRKMGRRKFTCLESTTKTEKTGPVRYYTHSRIYKNGDKRYTRLIRISKAPDGRSLFAQYQQTPTA
jgi:hypothetical protein